MRVHELAKELGIESRRILDEAKKAGTPLNNHMSGITEEQTAHFRQVFGKSGAAAPKAPPPAAKAPSPTQKATVQPAGEKAPVPPAAPTPPRNLEHAGERTERLTGKKPLIPAIEDEEEVVGQPGVRKPKHHVKSPKFGVEPAPPIALELEEVVAVQPPPPPKVIPAARRPLPIAGRRDRERSGGRGFRSAPRMHRHQFQAPQVAKEAVIALPITIKELSNLIGIRANQIIALLMRQNILANINSGVAADTVRMIAKEFGVKAEVKEAHTLEQQFEEAMAEGSKPEDLKPRAPIVTFMGHVDHGKTSLLDRIRNASVAAGEAGGITQHIGAYRAKVRGKYVTFLDTPGHEAFTAMRARGANVTDVVVLVVAADDGVMPQTEEALDHARAAEVPIVVAVNKIDKPEAKPERVRSQLAEKGLMPEEWGGDTVFVDVSAVTGQGIEEMLEMLAMVAELQNLRANPSKKARGSALEARMSNRGIAVTLLLQDGTLRRGDVVLCGSAYGRVKAIYDEHGKDIHEAGPAMPVEVLGLSEAPAAGEPFMVVESAAKAKEIAESRQETARQADLLKPEHVSLETLFAGIEAGKVKELRLIVKADVKGTIEALQGVLDKMPKQDLKLRVLRNGVGGVATSDVLLADASDAIIIGLHVGADPQARMLAERRGVQLRMYDVIFHATEDIHKALEGMLEPEEKEKITGHAQVRQAFKVSRVGTVAGCYVTDGVIPRNASIRILRDQGIAYKGAMESLRRFKDDVREVREGFECGIKIANFDDVKVGDIFEAFIIEKIAQTLSSKSPSA